MYALIVAGIFVLICCVIAWHYARKRIYKEDALRFVNKETEHVLQQRLDIEKIKAQKVVKKVKDEPSGFSLASMLGALISIVITTIVLVNVVIPITRQFENQTSIPFNSGEIALWGVVTLVTIAGFGYYTMSVFGLGGD